MMTAHHKQALEMANSALTRAKRPEIKQLAQNIIKDQTAEIGQMQQWYQSWYKSNL